MEQSADIFRRNRAGGEAHHISGWILGLGGIYRQVAD